VGVRVSGTVVNGELPGSAARATAHAAGASSGAAIATMDAAARHRRIIKGSTTESASSSVNITDAGAGATDTVSQSIGRGTDSVNVQGLERRRTGQERQHGQPHRARFPQHDG
jgi:hypothetical protein